MKIKAPNKQYSGLSAGVTFVNGIGETSDPHLLDWFRKHGYEVEEPAEDDKKEPGSLAEMTVKELKALAEEKGIEVGSRINKPDLLELIESQMTDGGEGDDTTDD